MPKNTKAKAGFLRRVGRIVASHVYDLGNKVLNEGIENAKDEHDVTIPTNKGLKAIIKEALDTNKNVIADLKATRSEMTELLKDASRQAIAALKNDKEGLTSEEDQFLASLDIDLDDFDDEELEDIMDGDFDDDVSDDDSSFESDIPDSYVGTDIDKLSAGVLLLVRTGCHKDEYLSTIFDNQIDTIAGIISGMDQKPEETSVPQKTDKLELAKSMMKNISEDITSQSIGLEDDLVLPESEDLEEEDEYIDEDAVVVVEVIPTEVPVRETMSDMQLKNKVEEVVEKYLENARRVMLQDPKIHSELNIIDSKIEAVCTYLSSITEKDKNYIYATILSVIPNPRDVGLAFYFNLLPEEIITAGKRILAVYNKIN